MPPILLSMVAMGMVLMQSQLYETQVWDTIPLQDRNMTH